MSDEIKLRYPALKTVEDIDTAIAGAITAAKTMKLKVQYGAIGCMILAAMDGKDKESGKDFADLACERANYLVNQVGAGVHGAGLVKFLVYRCGFKVNEADKKAGFIDVAKAEWIRKGLEAAKTTVWWSYSPAMPFKGFDLAQELDKVLTRADNAAKIAEGDKAKAKMVDIDRDMLETFQCILTGKPVHSKHALKLVESLIPVEEVEEEAASVAAQG